LEHRAYLLRLLAVIERRSDLDIVTDFAEIGLQLILNGGV
jgi:hypothetical protein